MRLLTGWSLVRIRPGEPLQKQFVTEGLQECIASRELHAYPADDVSIWSRAAKPGTPPLSVADAPVKFSWAICKSRPQFLNSFM